MNPFNNPNQQQGMQYNPNFNIQNTHLANFNFPNPNNLQGLINPNLQPMAAQNNQLGVLHFLVAQLQNNPQLQINLLNQLQTQNLAAHFNQMGMPFMGHNPIQGLNNMMGMPNGQFPGQNQLMGFLGNLQLGQNNMGLDLGNVVVSSGPMKTQGNQNAQQASGSRQLQVNHVDYSHAISLNSASRGSTRTSYRIRKERPRNRFQKSQSHDVRSSNGSMKKFNKRGRRGQHNWREQKSQSTNSGEKAPTVRQRPFPVNYTKAEIQLWREARKNNFPTRANINKKATDGENSEDADAKLRREQLKEVLLKQAELGVEVAEVPPSYLHDPKDQVPENESKRELTGGQSANRFNKKRSRGHGQDNRRSKRREFKNGGPPAGLPSVKKEPSLLEKLLSANIKRDKSRLLQAFQFMVLNDFFKQWPDKPLAFPLIAVKDGVDATTDESIKKAVAEGISNQKESSKAEEIENESDEEHTFGISEVASLPEEQFEESEEGQITD